MNLEHDTAFAPFYDATAIVSGKRRETGASAARDLSHTVPCCVLGGDLVDVSNNAGAPAIERSYTVMLRRADWPDHMPPQPGDALSIDGYPVMRASSVLPASAGWSLSCRSKGVAP